MYRDTLRIEIFDTREKMGQAAAKDIAAAIKELLRTKDEINMIFAAAPSQSDCHRALREDESIDWSRVNAFHMDEYIGLSPDAPQGFGNFLRRALFDILPFKSVNLIDSSAADAAAECERYTALLKNNPCDIVVMGVGENGHIAFNDPPVADFNDSLTVKPVKLDEICRQQQVNDGCFATIDEVPTHAITLTVPTLMAPPTVFCIVPGKTKAQAIYDMLELSIDESCPASILRTHKNATLYLDADSGKVFNYGKN